MFERPYCWGRVRDLTFDDLRELDISDEESTPEELLQAVQRLRELGVPLEEMAGWTSLFEGATDLSLRQPTGRVSPSEAIARAGTDAETASRIALALGFPLTQPSTGLSEDTVELFTFIVALGDRLGQPEALAFARVLGSSVARIAHALVSLFRLNLELPLLESGGSRADVIAAYYQLGQEYLPLFTRAVDTTLRRHLARASQLAWSTDPERTATLRTVAVGFADIVDFTAMVANSSVDRLVEAVDAFESVVTNFVVYRGGEVAKLIGDEVMFIAPDVDTGLQIARRLLDLSDDRLPPLRVGLAYGEVATVHGDYYGSVVNLASRLVDLAAPGEIVATAEFGGTPLPRAMVRGFAEPIDVRSIGRSG